MRPQVELARRGLADLHLSAHFQTVRNSGQLRKILASVQYDAAGGTRIVEPFRACWCVSTRAHEPIFAQANRRHMARYVAPCWAPHKIHMATILSIILSVLTAREPLNN